MNDRSYKDSPEFEQDKNDILADDENKQTSDAVPASDSFQIVPEDAAPEAAEPKVQIESKSSERKKKKNSVPLLAYVASLLAVLLVCGMFTVAIASATRYYGYLEGLSASIESGNGSGSGSESSGVISDTLDFSRLDFLDRLFRELTYNDIDDVDFMTAILKAYVEATGDLYAEYYTQEEYSALLAENAGQSVGIGVSVIQSSVNVNGTDATVLEIVTVFPNSPAEKAGVQPGDLVLYVGRGEDRQLVHSIGYLEALNRLRGEKGSTAEFTVLRPLNQQTYEEQEFSIVRDEYTMQSVEYKVSETDSTVGIVRILQFDLTTPTQLTTAMDSLIEKGITKFVLDIRNNPGGDLKSICAVLSYFLEENDLIISQVDRDGNKTEHFAVPVTYTGTYESCSVKKDDIGKYRDYDLAVLTNGFTASAAELFTANMRDYHLATVIGTKTYGKGSVQSLIPLFYYGYEGALKLTTSHYFPPCGEGYDGIGVFPDIEEVLSEEAASVNIYKLAEADDNQLQRVLEELRKP